MPEKKIMGLVGIAEKAGKTASGGFLAEQAIKAGKAYLLIIADDSSAGTKKKLDDLCTSKGCPVLYFSNKQDLAHAIGKEERSCVAILDRGLAEAISQAAERLSGKQGE